MGKIRAKMHPVKGLCNNIFFKVRLKLYRKGKPPTVLLEDKYFLHHLAVIRSLLVELEPKLHHCNIKAARDGVHPLLVVL